MEGARVSKEQAVKTMQHFTTLIGLEVFHEGVCLTGGHTLRITGAQHMASIGVEVYIIQLIGRWGRPSSASLRARSTTAEHHNIYIYMSSTS